MHIYDYVRVDGDEELQNALARLGELGLSIISISQYEHSYTIFFIRQKAKKKGIRWLN